MAMAKIKDDHSLPQIENKIGRLDLPGIKEDKLRVAVAGMLDAASYYETWRTKGLKIRGGLTLVLGSVEAETA
jgi:hypothetical protein